MLEFQYIECTFVNEVSNLGRVRAWKSPGCVLIFWAMQVIFIIKQKHRHAVCFFSFIGLSLFFFQT